MTEYEKGVRLEREVINIFKKHGYEALRSAGSHGLFDVTLIKTTEGGGKKYKKVCFVAFVQCKVTSDLNSDVEKLVSD